jgi:hypothetical protein
MEREGRGGWGSHLELCGLENLGDTCYMNSVLQALASSPPIVRAMLDSDAAEHLKLSSLIQEMTMSGKRNPVAPREFLDSIFEADSTWVTTYGAERDKQQSADEFLMFLIESIQELEGCVKFNVMQYNNALIPETFLKVTLENSSKTDLQSLIRAQYPGTISDLSQILIIVVVRWSNKGAIVKKNDTEIVVPQHLEMCNYKLDLRAVVVHTGKKPHYGHYTTYSKHAQQWILCDDSTIAPVTVQDTLRAAGKGFILMFERQNVPVKPGARRGAGSVRPQPEQPIEISDDEVCEIVEKPAPKRAKTSNPAAVAETEPTWSKRMYSGSASFAAGIALSVLRPAPTLAPASAKQDKGEEEQTYRHHPPGPSHPLFSLYKD